jgi:hypothetical protein
MAGERLDVLEHLRVKRLRLDREPLVDHQRVAAIAVVEIEQLVRALGRLQPGEHHQRALAVGHVVGALVLPGGHLGRARGRPGGEEHQRLGLELARAARGRVEAIGHRAGPARASPRTRSRAPRRASP